MEEHTIERDEGSNPIDRISQLPEFILHRILYFLSQEEAAQTCVLSKAWRHICSTRLNIQFDICRFKGNKQAFLSVLDRTLQRYHDQKLCMQKFNLSMSEANTDSAVSLLKKWMPIVLLNMGVKEFSFCLYSTTSWGYDLWSVLFQAKFLEKLYLERCHLHQKPPADKLLFKHLRDLYLDQVCIEEETFQKIISSCPLIENVGVHRCDGLRTVKLINVKLHNLKKFAFTHYRSFRFIEDDDGNSIEINVPTLETIRIADSVHWFHDCYKFPNLVSLYLSSVRLSTKLFDDFSCNFPILEKLVISYCYGFNELQISSHSIKHFILRVWDIHKLFKCAIDFPNILTFEYSGDFPTSISFKSTSRLTKSKIFMWFHVNVNADDDASSWFSKLNEMLRALSQSEISLSISQIGRKDPPQALLDINGSGKPLIIVEDFRFISSSPSFAAALLNGAFSICRPRIIVPRYSCPYTDSERWWKHVTEYLCKTRLVCQNDQEYNFWQQDLEEVSVEVYDEDAEEWHPVYRTSLPECAFPNNEIQRDVRFQLKWREDSFIN